jgi:uncharacterized membrane protein (DUF4010 family)
LWTVVLIFLALNFAGYIARKIAGAERGYGVTGILGGIISSTAVSFQFSRLSRGEPALVTGLAIGVIGACTVLIARVLFLSSVLNRAVALELLPLVLPAFVVGALLTAAALWRQHSPATTSHESSEQSPLRFWSAIRMALALQLALMVIAFVRDTLGTTGVLASAALLGLTDTDALTLSMNRLGSTPDLIRLGARAIAVGVLSNSALKLGLVLGLGAPAFRLRAGAGLALLTAASAISLWLFW